MIFPIKIDQTLLVNDIWQDPRPMTCPAALAMNRSFGFDGELLHCVIDYEFAELRSLNSEQRFGRYGFGREMKRVLSIIDMYPGHSGLPDIIFHMEFPDEAWAKIQAEVEAVRRMLDKRRVDS